jgi:hypothetical protein
MFVREVALSTVLAMIVELLPLSPHAPLRNAPPRLLKFRAERRSAAREWERALFARAEFPPISPVSRRRSLSA